MRDTQEHFVESGDLKSFEHSDKVCQRQRVIGREMMTPKSLTWLIFGVLIVLCLVQYGHQTKEDGCPKITVKKNSILRTVDSIKAGAKYLSKQVVDGARKCYKLCCGRVNCNLALLQYKNGSDGGIERTCYQFDCGNPSKCIFAAFPHYASIIFEPRHQELIPTTARPTTKSLAQEFSKLIIFIDG